MRLGGSEWGTGLRDMTTTINSNSKENNNNNNKRMGWKGWTKAYDTMHCYSRDLQTSFCIA